MGSREGLFRVGAMGEWRSLGDHVGSSTRSFARSKIASLKLEKRLGPATAPNGRWVRR